MKKKTLLIIVSLLISIFNISCSNDDSASKAENLFSIDNIDNLKYIRKTTNSFFPNEARLFNYKNVNLLTSKIFFDGINNNIHNSYEYDDANHLISKTEISFGEFSFEYDNKGRIYKQNLNRTNNYIELSYQNTKVIATEYSEHLGQATTKVTEFLLNKNSKITRITTLSISSKDLKTGEIESSNGSVPNFIYEYDEKGNIIKIIEGERVSELKYDDKINPFYISFSEYYKFGYFFDSLYKLNINYDTGLTPNNIIEINVTDTNNSFFEKMNYKYDDDNYPTSWTTEFSFDDVKSPERFIEYY